MADRLVSHLHGVKSLLWLGAALAAAGTAAGQSADARNAATWYARAFDRLGSIEITEAEWDEIQAYQKDPNAMPSEALRAVLARVGPVLSAARRGAQQDHSDFGLDYAQGYDLVLPHLSQLRSVGRLMAADARLRLHDGTAPVAADEIASMYRMAEHLGGDATIISSLVGQAIFEAADRVAASGIDRGAFGPAESTALRDALNQCPRDDPFAMIGAIEMEKLLMVDWTRQRYAEAEDRASLLEDWGADPGAAAGLTGLTLMDQAQFDAALDEADRTLGRIVEAFRMDDPGEARLVLDKIMAEIERGEHGPLAMFMPAYTKLYQRLLEARDEVAERTAQLDAIIAGAVTPAALANAAVLYLQAVAMIDKIEPSRWGPLREVIDRPVQPIGEGPAATLRDADAIVQLLGQAAAIPRCDFSIVLGRYPPVIPDYLAGLRKAGVLLVSDAVRMLQDARDDEAARRLWICFRMSAHLAGDPPIISALVSHTLFNGADELARWAMSNDAFSTRDRGRLFAGVDAMPRRDPFGYVASVRSGQQQILQRLNFNGEPRIRADQVLSGLDGDRLLYLLVVIDTPTGPDAEPRPEPTDLADVLALDALATARAQAEPVLRMIRDNSDLGPVAENDVPVIGHVAERFAAARADLRRAYFALQPEAGTSADSDE